MTFTEITGDVGLQPGTKRFNCFASGTVYKGQGVYITYPPANKDPNLIWVGAPQNSSQRLFGVCAYGASTGEPVAVYGPFNLVRVRLSGSVAAGEMVGLSHYGMFSNYAKYKNAVVVEGGPSTGDGTIFLFGWYSTL